MQYLANGYYQHECNFIDKTGNIYPAIYTAKYDKKKGIFKSGFGHYWLKNWTETRESSLKINNMMLREFKKITK